MSGERVDSKVDTADDFGDHVMEEIGSLRDELTCIRRMLEREHSLERAFEEFRCLPYSQEKLIRWGFMGAHGQGGQQSWISVYTTTEDKFFDGPHADDTTVAAFASAFTDPNAIAVCKHLFRRREAGGREEIKEACGLTDEQLDSAVKPLLDWRCLEWQGDKLAGVGHGLALAVTLIGLTKTAITERDGVKY